MASEISERTRAAVARRAGGRCEYCLIHQDDAGFSHQIDHIVSRKHGGPSDLDNLAYACVLCNRHKGTDIATLDRATGEVVNLFHPRRDRWADHFRLDEEFTIQPLTAVGAATIRLLRLNAMERVTERQFLGLRRDPGR